LSYFEKKFIHLIAAARPNFMKIAPLYHALIREVWAEPLIVHTGQHYDTNMSDAFFTDLGLPKPHVHLGIGSGSHAEQTGNVMIAYEKLILENRPDLVVVVGDVNSTVASTLAAVKLGVKVAHLEAGLRSFDRSMPEEINRVVTDALAELLWTPSPDGDENLLREGVTPEKIVRVGNIMIDSLEMMRPTIDKENSVARYGLNKGSFGLVTLHRPSNVDDKNALKTLCDVLIRVAEKLPLIFPVHPRTRKNIDSWGLLKKIGLSKKIHMDVPLSYIQFMSLLFDCRLVITDSGGVQEETSYLGIPCLTLRPNTERPITISHGTNRLCTTLDVEELVLLALTTPKVIKKIPLWDGCTAPRVVASIRDFLSIGAKH
jgi:UDP-N-acetylglucosamine 2-epimerase (non-hydrolysing)